MVATREKEINEFKPKTYYGLQAKVTGGVTYTWRDDKNNTRIFQKEKADKLFQSLKGETLTIDRIDKAAKKKYAPQLYDLTELQRDANRLFGFSGKQTLSIMQSLYERHKVLTYPRTDSRVISTDIVPTLNERLEACGIDQYASVAQTILRKGIKKLPKSVVDNAKVSDHHAIIPTEEPVYLSNLDAKERRIYDLVVKRFLAVLMDPYEYEQTTIHARISEEAFTANGRIIKNQGWRTLYDRSFDEDDFDNQSLPSVKQGDTFTNFTLNLTNGETKPPERFTEGALLQAMENPVRYMDADEKHLAGTLQKSGGIGTVATRADIIDKLFNSEYMELKGKHIFITPKGKQLLDLAPEDLRSPALTAEWEQKLSLIADGKLNKNKFIAEIKDYTKEIIQEIKANDATFKHDNITGTKCPDCGKLMLEVRNRHGRMLVCQDRSCGHKKNIAKRTNARCPNCHKRLELRGEGEGQIFTCSCGHREKLSTFNKRKQHEKKHKVSKRDVNKYLKNQDDGFKNNALAEQLAKLRDKK